MDTVQSPLNNSSILIRFAYAPTGLGHLRVTDALFHGLPPYTSPLLLGAQDKSLTYLHRLASTHPLIRLFYNTIGEGLTQDITTFLYKKILLSNTELLYQQLITILDQRIEQ